MKGGGSSGTTTVETEPWGPSKRYIRDILSEAERLYGGRGPEYYPYSTVAPLSGYSKSARDLMASRALGGSPLLQAGQQSIYDVASGGYFGGGPSGNLFQHAAQGGMANPATSLAYGDLEATRGANPALGLLADTAEGRYLNANPYIDAAFGNAAESIRDQYTDATSATNAYFSRAGRSGSGAFGEARGDLDETLVENLGDLSEDYYLRNYLAERQNQLGAASGIGNFYNTDIANRLAGTGQYGRLAGGDIATQLGAGRTMEDLFGRDMGFMMGAATAAPGMAREDYLDLEQLGKAGAVTDTQRQREIEDAFRRWQYYQEGPGSELGKLDRYKGYVYPTANFGGTTGQPYYNNTFGNIASTGLAIAGLLM